jgi:hypothetical protein
MNYYSDDEYDYDDEQRQKKVILLKDLTLKDYLAYKDTRISLENEWNKKIEDEIREDSDALWKDMRDKCKHVTNIGELIEDIHKNDMFEMIRYHLVPQYDLGLFEENPDLAMGLVNKIDQIRSNERNRNNERMRKDFNEANVKFIWGK